MLRPRIPVNPLPTGFITPLAQPAASSAAGSDRESSPMAAPHESSAASIALARTQVQLTPGSAIALAAGGGAVVLVVGAVLVSMLLAVAITGVSVAVIAVVLRLLVKDLQKGR
ncbi:SpdD-like protein [Streptomyces sp. NPDC056387]|uniref:SpdD-like protein n=1 Tax=Streptomyces sp. NPDC056387 TaxID=3345803 RepID=UPI0035DACD4A